MNKLVLQLSLVLLIQLNLFAKDLVFENSKVYVDVQKECTLFIEESSFFTRFIGLVAFSSIGAIAPIQKNPFMKGALEGTSSVGTTFSIYKQDQSSSDIIKALNEKGIVIPFILKKFVENAVVKNNVKILDELLEPDNFKDLKNLELNDLKNKGVDYLITIQLDTKLNTVAFYYNFMSKKYFANIGFYYSIVRVKDGKVLQKNKKFLFNGLKNNLFLKEDLIKDNCTLLIQNIFDACEFAANKFGDKVIKKNL